jgi:hypothetical protein
MKHVRDRWTIENFWHLPRDTQLREDAHRYRETNGVQIMATLGRLAMNALRLDGFCRSLRAWPLQNPSGHRAFSRAASNCTLLPLSRWNSCRERPFWNWMALRDMT